MAKPTAAEILADPGTHTVEEVTDAFTSVGPGEVEQAKALEAAEKGRVGILNWRAPEPEPVEPKYTRQRILDLSEGPAIVGHIDALGRTAKHPDIVGALEGADADYFTRGEVAELITDFLTRPLEA